MTEELRPDSENQLICLKAGCCMRPAFSFARDRFQAATGTDIINPMKIDCYISEGCSSEEQLRKNLQEATKDAGIMPEIHFHKISEETARSSGIAGSPSVLIDGADILPGETPGIS